MLNLQIAIREKQPPQARYIQDIRGTARYLFDRKLSIPAVVKYKALLAELLSDEYWEKLHIAALEEVRLALRALLKFIEKNIKNPVYAIFEDTLGEIKDSPELLPATGDLTNYKYKVAEYIEKHKDYLVIRKLIYNEQITTYDIQQLESVFSIKSSDLMRILKRPILKNHPWVNSSAAFWGWIETPLNLLLQNTLIKTILAQTKFPL